MNNTNLTIQIGNLIADPELSMTPSGTAICKFSIAVNDDYGDKTDVSFFNVVTWNKIAETCNTYLNKGSKVCITGKLKQDRWEKDGQKYSKINIVANKVEFLGKKQDNQVVVADNATVHNNTPPVNNEPVKYNISSDNDDDIPF